MRINTNVASMVAQENANNVNKNLSSSLEKLSSGLRINKAADDASGMAIADKLRTQASSLGQSISNANSANALVQIADKAMAEQSNILDIVKTKLIQASTSTTSAEGREAIRKDVTKLLEQLDNIANQTNYNGIKLLDEANKSLSFQVGESADFDITLETAYAATTTGLGAEQQVSNDEQSTIDYSDGVAIRDIGTTLSVQHDPNTDLDITTMTTATNKAVAIGTQESVATADGTAAVEVSATNVSAITFTVNANALTDIILKTDDAALRAELETFAAAGDITKVDDGVYTVDSTSEVELEFSEKIDISNLSISGISTSTTAADNDIIGIVTDDLVSVTKTDGAADISLTSAQWVSGGAVEESADAAAVGGANALTGTGTTTASGIVYTSGVTVDSGTVAAQYDTSDLNAADLDGAVKITNTDTNSEDASYTINADNVTQIALAAGANGEILLSSNDANMVAKLDELAENSGALTKINDGAYTFKADSTTAILDLGGEFNVKDLTVSTVAATDVVTVKTLDAVSVTKLYGDEDTASLELTAAQLTDGAVTDTGSLTGAASDTLSFSDSLAALKALGENELTAEIANDFMSVIDTALNQINTLRSDFGSTQNQLDSFIRNAMTTQTNIKAAESVIRDVDYAAESANFNKQNIIAQAGTYAMSQANAVQQNVMRLLQ